MNISYIDYSPKTKSLDIFVNGCDLPLCNGCCNPELANFNDGTEMSRWVDKIQDYIGKYDTLIENIFLLGGSFNHQVDIELECFFRKNSEAFKNKQIWLFCREELENVKDIFKQKCHYIKCGPYIPELLCENNIQENIKLATSNQNIYRKGKDY